MELEIQRYKKLVELYPSERIYCPENFGLDQVSSQLTHFDINLTRYLYMKIFNSMPPENIWSFRKLLELEFLDSSVLVEEATHVLEIKIGTLGDSQLSTQIISLNVKPSETFDKVKKELISRGMDCKLLIDSCALINPTTKISNTKVLYVVC